MKQCCQQPLGTRDKDGRGVGSGCTARSMRHECGTLMQRAHISRTAGACHPRRPAGEGRAAGAMRHRAAASAPVMRVAPAAKPSKKTSLSASIAHEGAPTGTTKFFWQPSPPSSHRLAPKGKWTPHLRRYRAGAVLCKERATCVAARNLDFDWQRRCASECLGVGLLSTKSWFSNILRGWAEMRRLAPP